MRLFNINGRLQKKSVSKYLINWNKKSRSKVQFKTKKFLEPFWRGHIVYEEFPVYGSRMTVDILNATKKLAVEVQGKQHGEFNKFFHIVTVTARNRNHAILTNKITITFRNQINLVANGDHGFSQF